MKNETKNSAIRAFTLIEIMVVLAIIAIVSALLFPVFASAKHSAKAEVGKQYLKQQFLALEIYAGDMDGVYPSYYDVIANKALQAPCSPLYDWKQPCWAPRQEVVPNPVGDAPSPMMGGRGYIYAVRNWQDIEKLGKDVFLGWDRNKPYPILCDIFEARYHVREFAGEQPDLNKCVQSNGVLNPNSGCLYPDTVWYGYSDGSLRVSRRTVILEGPYHELFDWYHVFLKRMDDDTRKGN